MNNSNSTADRFAAADSVLASHRPVWATGGNFEAIDRDGNPIVQWARVVVDESTFSAVVERMDVLIEEDLVRRGDVTLQAAVGAGAEFATFATPEAAREAAQRLLAAADEFEAVMSR